jgi:ppGpp synthetase/RelA/SpoT-type nucleotidyltranferase
VSAGEVAARRIVGMSELQPHERLGVSRRAIDRAGDLLRGRTLPGEDLLAIDERDAINLLERFRAEFEGPLRTVVGDLRELTVAEGIAAQPTERLKRVPRIIEKLVRHPTMQLSRMQDIAGCRIVVSDLKSVARVQGTLLANWTVERVDDYNRSPKATGYRALHVVVRAQASSVEVQVRTPWQQAWARSIELLDARLNLSLKDGLGPEALMSYVVPIAYALEATYRGDRLNPTTDAELEALRAEAERWMRERGGEP